MAAVDWLVVALYVVGMLAIGRYSGRRVKTAKDYHLGGGRMSPFAVGLSLFAALTSSLSYLAVPGELIRHGPMVIAVVTAYPFIALVVGWGLIPFIMRQQMTSAYSMLEERLGVGVRLLGSTMFLAMRLVWMGAILFAISDKVLSPLLGLGLNETFMAAIGVWAITLIYTAEGGLRAVILTDAIQSLIMLGGAAAVIAIISADLGGISAWWPRYWAPHWDPPRFGIDSNTRMTFLGAGLSTFAWYVCTFGSDQMAIQRWLSTRDVRSARRSLVTTLLAEAIVIGLLGMVGLALVGYFTAHPDRLQGGLHLVADADKLFPRFVLVGLPRGLTGIIIAAVVASSMGSLSSGMNSACAVITEDFIVRFHASPLSDAGRVRLARWISVGVGIAAISLSLLVSRVPGNLLEVCYRVVNLSTAPLFVLFFLAMFVRWATPLGAVLAAATSFAAAACIAYSKELGLVPLSMLWIMPGSFVTGVAVGSLASLLPIGRRRQEAPGTTALTQPRGKPAESSENSAGLRPPLG